MTRPNFKVSIDAEEFSHKPSTKLQYKDVVDRYGKPRSEVSVLGARLGSEVEELSLAELARRISSGCTWSPYIFKKCPLWKRRRRLEGLFESCEIFALDFDNNESLDQILELGETLGVSISLVHTSFSSGPDNLKHRAIVLTNEPITDFELTKKISIGLAHAFDSDKSCVDTARLYFGSKPDCVVYFDPDCSNTIENLNRVADSVQAQQYISKQTQAQHKPDVAVWGDSTIQKEIWNKIPKNKLNSIKRKVQGILLEIRSYKKNESKKKSRYECVWRSTSRIARMQEITGAACYAWVMEAIKSNNEFDNWDKNAHDVVISAIEWSASHADDPI